MAIAGELFFVVSDAKGDVSRVAIPVEAGDAINWTNAAAAVAALINPLVTGGLRQAGVSIYFDLSGTWGTVAALASDVQEKAEFALRSIDGFIKRINLPTFDEAFFTAGTGLVDLTDTAVQAWVTFLEDGITVGGVDIEPEDSRGFDLESLEYAAENWGKRRR